ncbi:hypothetical protein [Flavobacterium ginsenosidimutans]|uniref:hypothetical protein n=1 Tax=Flavobacterium ginsenosidimutans TaxID=687844 RepID=UPI003D96D8A8
MVTKIKKPYFSAGLKKKIKSKKSFIQNLRQKIFLFGEAALIIINVYRFYKKSPADECRTVAIINK